MDDYDKYYEKYLKYKNKYLELKQDGGGRFSDSAKAISGLFDSAKKTIIGFSDSEKTKNKNKSDMPNTTPFILILGNNTILSETNFNKAIYSLEEIHNKLNYNVCEEKRNLSYIITHLGKLLEFCYNRKNFNCGKKPSSVSFNKSSNYLDDYRKLDEVEKDTNKEEKELAIERAKWKSLTDYISKDQKEKDKYDKTKEEEFKSQYNDKQLRAVVPEREIIRIDNREKKIKDNESTIDEITLDSFTRTVTVTGQVTPRGTQLDALQDQLDQAKKNRLEFNKYRFANIVLDNRIILKDTTDPTALKLLSSDELNKTIKKLTEIINKYIERFHETCNRINTYAIIKYDSDSSRYVFETKPSPIP